MRNAKIIDSCAYSKQYEIVLCELETERLNQYVTYVTWEHKIDTADNYFWGHYFDNRLQAEIDFHQRCIDNLKMQVPPFGGMNDENNF